MLGRKGSVRDAESPRGGGTSALVALGTEPAAAGDRQQREARLELGCPKDRRKAKSPFGKGFVTNTKMCLCAE